MHFLSEIINYIVLFIALYFEVFLLITYFESRPARKKVWSLPAKLPSVTILVPCWNEEKTIAKTIISLLNLDYPKNKLSIFIINDGSTDNTWSVLQRFAKNRQIRLFKKENGGKASALNHGLQFVESDLVGCLDADSFVHRATLKKIVARFSDPQTMAVTPSIKVYKPKNLVELIQKVEYSWGILIRNLLTHLGALYIAPGPFSIFRKEVFNKLGGYHEAHKTEDMELALRMHENKMKIENVPDAFVSTAAPKSPAALYRQRLRWTYGFLKNAIDYRRMFFNPRYGNLGVMVLPIASFSLFSSLYLAIYAAVSSAHQIFLKLVEFQTIGFSWNWPPGLEWFYFNTDIIAIAGFISLIGTVTFLLISMKMAQEKTRSGLDIFYFLFLYIFLYPFWVSRAIWNVAFSQNTKWR